MISSGGRSAGASHLEARSVPAPRVIAAATVVAGLLAVTGWVLQFESLLPARRAAIDATLMLYSGLLVWIAHRAARFLRHRAVHLASIIDASDDAIVSKSLDGIIQTWN